MDSSNSSAPSTADRSPDHWAYIMIRFVDEHAELFKHICIVPIDTALPGGRVSARGDTLVTNRTKLLLLHKSNFKDAEGRVCANSIFLADDGHIMTHLQGNGVSSCMIIYHSELEQHFALYGNGEEVVRGLHKALIENINLRNERNSKLIRVAEELELHIGSRSLELDMSPESCNKSMTMPGLYAAIRGQRKFSGRQVSTRHLIHVLCSALAKLPDLPAQDSVKLAAGIPMPNERRESLLEYSLEGDYDKVSRSNLAIVCVLTSDGETLRPIHGSKDCHALMVTKKNRLLVVSISRNGTYDTTVHYHLGGHNDRKMLVDAFSTKKVSRGQIICLLDALYWTVWHRLSTGQRKEVEWFRTLIECFSLEG